MHQPASGPIIMPPINMGIVVPMIIPIVAIAPRTPPRTSATIFPPVYPIKSGNKYIIIGPTTVASFSFGNHPVGINNAVINPQAINAPIFGITMPLKKRPNL